MSGGPGNRLLASDFEVRSASEVMLSCPACDWMTSWERATVAMLRDCAATHYYFEHGSPRGACPACGHSYRLRKDGTVGPHAQRGVWPPTLCAGWRCAPTTSTTGEQP